MVACARTAASKGFQTFITIVILANALVLGLSTYSRLNRSAGDVLNLLEEIFLGIFVVELAIRITAFGSKPQLFFRDGWNVFDFVVISAAFVPGVRDSVTLLRLVRLVRVVRLASVRSDMRTVLTGMKRSIPAIGSLLLIIMLLIYFYAMLGWAMFHTEDPKNWGTIGDALLTLFTVVTLEGWNEVLYQGQKIEPWAWVYFVSFVLLVSFLLINVLMAFVLNAVERAREPDGPEGAVIDGRGEIESRLHELRQRLTQLEMERAREEAELIESARDYALVDTRLEEVHKALMDLEAEFVTQVRQHPTGVQEKQSQ